MEDKLDQMQMKIVCECLKAAAYGPFFIDKHSDNPYWEIHTLFGLFIDELREIADNCPNIDIRNEKVKLAINNSINHLLGYPHGCDEATWGQYISVSPEELDRIFDEIEGRL